MAKKEIMWPMGRGSNDASYVTETDFRDFVAFGMAECWLSHDPDDCNADANMARPITTGDVKELRGHFLNCLEDVIYGLWTGDLTVGQGQVDRDHGGSQTLVIDIDDENSNGNDATMIDWYARLDNDAIMLEMAVSGCDSQAIWLSYDALTDRKNVIKVLKEARKFTFNKKLFDKLLKAALQPNVPLYVEVDAE